MNSKDFEKEVIEKSKKVPVIVDFYADWCMPCRILGPILEKLAKEHKGKLILVKINTEEAPELAEKYSIMSIPNVKLFKKGKLAGEFVGVQSEEKIKEMINKSLR